MQASSDPALTTRSKPRLHQLLLVVGFALLLASWVMANPPGSAPDEATHYLKAVATSQGEGVGARLLDRPGKDTILGHFQYDVLRRYSIPARFVDDPRWTCDSPLRSSAVCLDAPLKAPLPTTGRVDVSSYVGPYPPLPYLPMAAGIRLTSSTRSAVYAGRAGAALLCLALFAIAVVLLEPGWEVTGLLVALTPSSVFLASTMTTSGIEIMAGAGTAAGTIALARQLRREDRPPPSTWAAVAFVAATLALCRVLGPLWIALYALALICLVGFRRTWQGLRRGGRPATVAVVVVGLATVAAALWDVLVMPSQHSSVRDGLAHLGDSYHLLHDLLEQGVAFFGWLDTPMPRLGLHVLYLVLAAALIGGLVLGSWSQRVVIALTVATTVGLAFALDAWTQIPVQFRVQARYVVPLAVLAFVVAGAAAARHQTAVRSRPAVLGHAGAMALLGTVVVLCQGAGWYVNARRVAAGFHGPLWLLQRTEWHPPAGWVPWLATAVLGTIVLVGGVVASTIEATRRRTTAVAGTGPA